MPLVVGASKVQRASKSRAARDAVQGNGGDLSQPLVRGEPLPLFVVDPGTDERKAFSNREEFAVQFAFTLLEGKWRVPILRQLQSGPIHLGELKRRLAPISKKVLNQHLREMVRDGLVLRTDVAGNMPRVQYSLSDPLGYAVLDLLQAVAEWGNRNCSQSREQAASVSRS